MLRWAFASLCSAAAARLPLGLPVLTAAWHPHSLPPASQVTHKRKRHYLGMHGSEESAAKAYDQGAIALLVRGWALS